MTPGRPSRWSGQPGATSIEAHWASAGQEFWALRGITFRWSALQD
jgi:hypothetical protein